jgi:N-acyl-D-amino-acid deacylase
MTLDTALENARIVDGTGAPWFRGAVGINDGEIARVSRTESIDDSAEERIDLDGLTLCPGFVDTHSHSDLRLFEDPTVAPKTRQGITTEILGQDGFSMAPMYRDGGAEEWEDHLSGLDGRTDREWTWGSVADYFDAIDESGVAVNVGMLVGHGTVRFNVMGMDDRLPTEAELEEMAGLVTEALDAGAIGFSTGLIYTPQVHSDTEEVRRLASRLAPYGRPFVAHIRNETDDIWAALDEFIDIGVSENVPLHLSHFKLALPPQHGKAERAIEIIEAARERDVDFTADQYPYTAGSTMLAVVLPSWVRADGTERAVEYLSDEESRAEIRDAMTGRSEPWENTVVTSVASDSNAHLEGLNVEEIAEERGVDPVTAVMDLLREEHLEVSKITHMLAERDVREILRYERATVATDGLFGGKPHPRTYGTYPRVLGHYVRDENLLSVEEAVRMMTSLPARAMGLQTKGIVRPGMDADLVAFDPQSVGTSATFQSPRRHPDGMPHVIVDGEFVVRDHGLTDATPGRAIRK